MAVLIGLTGGIASGKSTVAGLLADAGAIVLDADVIAREVVEPGTPALERIAARFGDGVLGDDGALDRAALGALVFSDDRARADLNAIVHPAVRERTEALIERARREAGEHGVVVYDVPLLVEASVDHGFDLVVVAEAPAEVRLARLTSVRGLSEEDASRRIAAQASDEERRARADVVLATGGTMAQTEAEVARLLRRLPAANRDADVGGRA